MQGKYQSWPRLAAAFAYRQWVRQRIKQRVVWHERPLRAGVTALVGMCHRLPDLLLGNLKHLDAHAWPALHRAIIVVDGERGCLPSSLEQAAHTSCEQLELRFHYYSSEQAAVAEQLALPYVYSWLSWSIGLGLCETKHALLHDYDALILDDGLSERHARFEASDAVIQGVKWYEGNGFTPEDRLATTFEAFVDVSWLMRFSPIEMFNQITVEAGRSLDYDTLLELQHKHVPESRRAVIEMAEHSLVHPSQMIHQFTMMRRHPERAEPCYSIPMIPLFELCSGKADAFARATARLRARRGKQVSFFDDGRAASFALLQTGSVDWALKQILQVCVSDKLPPDRSLYDYGLELYALADTSKERIWAGDFTPEQRAYIERARTAET